MTTSPTAFNPVRLLRYITSFRFLISTAIVAKMFWACRSGFSDPDIWWHLRHAQYLVSNHKFLTEDTFSFTAAGTHYLHYEWLSELFYYLAYRGGGFIGTFIFCSAMLSVLMLGVYSLCEARNQDWFTCGFAAVAATILAPVGSGPRMHLVGWLCFLVMFAILQRFRYSRDGKYLWLLPLLFCFWINCHPTWFFGLLTFAIIVASGAVPRDFGALQAHPWTPSELKRLLTVLCLSVAALFVNPFGYRLVKYPFDAILNQQLNIGAISEWSPVNFGDQTGVVAFGVLGTLFAVAIFSNKRWRIDDFLLTVFVTYSALRHIRFFILAAIVLPVILVGQIQERSSALNLTLGKRLINAALVAVVILVFIGTFPGAEFIRRQIDSELPSGAVKYLRANSIQGNMFNWFEWGGYLEWARSETKTFIDSRTDIFEYRGVLKDYLRAISGDQTYEVLDKYQICYAVLPKAAPVAYFLGKSPGWKPMYSDELSVVLGNADCQKSSDQLGYLKSSSTD
jgi:hypothetical protein